MTAQLALTLPQARCEAGIRAADDHADPEFKVAAYAYLCGFARTAHGLFISEDVSDQYEAAGLPKTHDKRAWASLWRRARRERVVEIVDSEGRSRIRRSPTYRYRSLVCRSA